MNDEAKSEFDFGNAILGYLRQLAQDCWDGASASRYANARQLAEQLNADETEVQTELAALSKDRWIEESTMAPGLWTVRIR